MKNLKVYFSEHFEKDEIFVNNIIYVPIYFSIREVHLSNSNNYNLKFKNDISYEFNARVEGIYKCDIYSFIVIDLGKIKVYSLLTENVKDLKEGVWITGIGIFEIEFRYWITDMNETVEPRIPPNIFYQYKINSIQEIVTSNECYYDILEYGEYIKSAKKEKDDTYILTIDLQKLDPEMYPSVAGGTKFHMRYLKPDWFR